MNETSTVFCDNIVVGVYVSSGKNTVSSNDTPPPAPVREIVARTPEMTESLERERAAAYSISQRARARRERERNEGD